MDDSIFNSNEVMIDSKVDDRLIEIIHDKTRKIMWSMVEFKELQMLYSCALKEVKTKFEILSTEFGLRYKRNPITSINTRIKSINSIIEKLIRNNLPVTLDSVEKNLNDVAGIRIICSYIDEIYKIADSFLKQDDIKLLEKKDYISNPKKNGYRSLHLIVEVPVFLSKSKTNVKVEVQIRTIAMNFWATLEHQIKYKKNIKNEDEICNELLDCANIINQSDERMLKLRMQIDEAEDVKTDDDILLDKIKKIDLPIY